MQTKIKEQTDKSKVNKPIISQSIPKQIKNLYLFTVNHKTAPVVIREKFAIPEYSLKETYQDLKKFSNLNSFFILSTCNRTEIYFTAKDLQDAISNVFNFLSNHLSLESKVVQEYCSILQENEVVNHIFKLACGLDSLVIGEKQILSQLKSAYAVAQTEKTLDLTLEILLQNAIKCAKEIHTNTNLSTKSQSISSVAVELANKVCGPLKTKSVIVLGAGTMAKLALEHILKIGGAKETVVLNKSPHRVIEFSEKYKVTRSFPFEDVYTVLNEVDILICAAGAPHFILFAEQFKNVRKDSNKSLFIFDVSMPRNIDDEFGRLSNVTLYDIDSIQQSSAFSDRTDTEEINKAEAIIIKNIKTLYSKLPSTEKENTIKKLREDFETIRQEKLTKLSGQKNNFSKEELDYITKNITNTIFHELLKTIKD